MRIITSGNAKALTLALILCLPLSDNLSAETFIFGSENFDSVKKGAIPDNWWVEGGQKVGVEDGHLRIKADPYKGSGKWCTVWTDIIVSGNVQISYDAQILSFRKKSNNVNMFIFYSDPSGTDLYASRDKRKDAKYSLYHDLDGYIITFVNKENRARIRIRRCPGFRLLIEDYWTHKLRGKTYHFIITKKDDFVTLNIDNGNYILTAEDPKPPVSGRIGFRTYKTDYWVDNLTIKSLSGKKY